jgi:hypothetical protein
MAVVFLPSQKEACELAPQSSTARRQFFAAFAA